MNEKHSPNIQTSLAEVNRRKFMDSGAIHLMGSFPLEAVKHTLLFTDYNNQTRLHYPPL